MDLDLKLVVNSIETVKRVNAFKALNTSKSANSLQISVHSIKSTESLDTIKALDTTKSTNTA